MEDKNKISDFIRKRLENFDHEIEAWESPDKNLRDTILGQVKPESKSNLLSIKPLHIAAILLIPIIGFTSFYFIKKHNESQAEIKSIYAELQAKKTEIKVLKEKVISLKNKNNSIEQTIISNEFTTHNPSNNDPLDQSIVSKNSKKNSSFEEGLRVSKITNYSKLQQDNSKSKTEKTFNNYASNNPKEITGTTAKKAKLDEINNRPKLNSEKLAINRLMVSIEDAKNIQESNNLKLLPQQKFDVHRRKNNLLVGIGIQGKSRPFKTEHKFNKQQPMEGQPPARTKLFFNKFMEVEYMISNRIGLYTGFGSVNAKMSKKSKFDYAFDKNNTVTNSNGKQYNEIEFRSSSNLGDNEGLVSFEVPEGIQNSDKINVTLSNSFTIKSINIPLGLNYYFYMNNKWLGYIGGGLNYESLYISKYNVKADLAYNSKEVTSKHLLKQPSDKNIQHVNYNIGVGAAYSINNMWSIQGDIQWNKNLYNNGKKHPPKHFDVDAKVGIYYRI